MVPADLEIGRQVVQPCLGEMELDKDIGQETKREIAA